MLLEPVTAKINKNKAFIAVESFLLIYWDPENKSNETIPYISSGIIKGLEDHFRYVSIIQ
jgi:hypothetical protein